MDFNEKIKSGYYENNIAEFRTDLFAYCGVSDDIARADILLALVLLGTKDKGFTFEDVAKTFEKEIIDYEIIK